MWQAHRMAENWAPPYRASASQADKENDAGANMWRDSGWGSYAPQFERGGGDLSVPIVYGAVIDAYYDGPEYAVDELELWEQEREYDRWFYDNHPSNR